MDALGIDNYERFDAIRPSLEMITADSRLFELYQRTWNRAAIGVVGCKLSHIEVIKLARQRGYNTILILEDDALFRPQFLKRLKEIESELEAVERKIGKFQMLYLGANHKEKGLVVSENLRRCKGAYTTSSYVVHHSIYDVIIKRAIEKPVEIDTFYVQYVQKYFNVLAASPNLIVQRPAISDISGNYAEIIFDDC